jgi:hypothetical protein
MEAEILIGGTMLDSILVGGATSLVNLIIHAVLLAGVAWTVRRVSVSDSFAPHVLQHTLVIVATGTLLVAGHFAEVVVWARAYDLVGAAAPRHRPHLFRLRQLHARLWRRAAPGALAFAGADDGAERHHADRLVDGADHRDLAP